MLDDVDKRMDRMTLTAIYQALLEDVLLMVAEKDSAKLAWETLKTMHVGVERVKDVNIRSLGEKVEEISVFNKFLRALPKTYMKIVTTIEQFGELKNMTVEEIVGRLKYGHYASECPNKRSDDEVNLTSFYDEEPSLMFVEVVTNSLPEDDDANITSFNDEEPILMFVEGEEKTNLEEFMQEPSKEEPEVALFNEEKVIEKLIVSGDECNHTDVWYLDNGASNHMTGHREKLNDLDKKIIRNVKFEDGSKAHKFLNPSCVKIYMRKSI
ncbi:uncharacterized protein LOC124936767 [Impatiens glandulifera]|uniref:uncharacterized protein LOC124936767 n=1 Tax=Impatiens glandulifera TaxID=253017 RepID=UPI001FB13F62|nr:uncharacterized protein LOC124936767 [Impatiens glandulifera]